MKITLVVDDRIWREFRADCIRRGVTASGRVERFMRAELGETEDVKKEEDERPSK